MSKVDASASKFCLETWQYGHERLHRSVVTKMWSLLNPSIKLFLVLYFDASKLICAELPESTKTPLLLSVLYIDVDGDSLLATKSEL